MDEESVVECVRAVRGPRPVLSRSRQDELTDRQRQLLDRLSDAFLEGFNHLTMADLAGDLGCSLRTLYSLAPSRDELVLIVVDLNLWRLGRVAVDAVHESMRPLEAVRAYLDAAHIAVANTTEAFARDCEAVEATRELNEQHANHVIAVTRALLDLAVRRGDIKPINTAAMARVVAGVGRDLARPEVLTTLDASPKQAADEVVDVILAGLAAG